MKTLQLTAYRRSECGKRPSKRLRKQGYIPCILYGKNTNNLMLKVKEQELVKLLERLQEAQYIIDLNVADADQRFYTVVKEKQIDSLNDKVLHVDFFTIDMNIPIKVQVPLRLTGKAQGVNEGGILEEFVHSVLVEALPQDIPEEFAVSIEHLKIGDSLYIKDIPIQENIKILEEKDNVIATVTKPKVKIEEEPLEELPTEPELIRKEREKES